MEPVQTEVQPAVSYFQIDAFGKYVFQCLVQVDYIYPGDAFFLRKGSPEPIMPVYFRADRYR